MDVKLSPEDNIQQFGFWHCFWKRLFKMILDIVHIRSLIFWIGTALAVRFMHSYLNTIDKTPNPYLGVAVVGVWFMLAVGVGWNRTWEDVWTAFCEALKNYKKP
jgi:hypothetical protein